MGKWHFLAREPENQSRIDEVVASVGDVKSSSAGFFAAIAQSLEEGGGNAVTLADGRRSIELVTAIYQSSRSGQSVSLPLGEGADLYQGWMP